MPIALGLMHSGGVTQGYAQYIHLFRLCISVLLLQDLLKGGATLAIILAAGQWRSAAFLRYLDEAQLEQDCARAQPCVWNFCFFLIIFRMLPYSWESSPMRRSGWTSLHRTASAAN